MKTANPEFIRQLKAVVKNSPYPRHMRMALTEISMDGCTVVMDLDRCHLQPYGIVHGGVLATLIDTATFWAAFLRLPQEDGLVNVDLKLNYLKSVTDGQLTATGLCIRPGRTISYAEARVVDGEGQLVAHGTSSLMALPGRGLNMPVAKFL